MSAVFLPSDLRQAASPLHACVLVGPVRLTVCSRGSVMSDAVLVSEGGWERAWEVLAEAPAPGESWHEASPSWSTCCVRLGGSARVNNALAAPENN